MCWPKLCLHEFVIQQPVFRSLGVSSDIVKVSLPRPMGLVFEEDAARGQVVVADFVQGSQAEKLSKVVLLYYTLSLGPRLKHTDSLHSACCYS